MRNKVSFVTEYRKRRPIQGSVWVRCAVFNNYCASFPALFVSLLLRR